MGLMDLDGGPLFDPHDPTGIHAAREAFERRTQIQQAMADQFVGKVFEELSDEDKLMVRSLRNQGLLAISGSVGKSIITRP